MRAGSASRFAAFGPRTPGRTSRRTRRSIVTRRATCQNGTKWRSASRTRSSGNRRDTRHSSSTRYGIAFRRPSPSRSSSTSRNAANKIAVTLGADTAHVSDGVEYFDTDAHGDLLFGVTCTGD